MALGGLRSSLGLRVPVSEKDGIASALVTSAAEQLGLADGSCLAYGDHGRAPLTSWLWPWKPCWLVSL
ncbi:hypothetical protein VULLAG_LOCUS14048 [Vulpes lagopus]